MPTFFMLMILPSVGEEERVGFPNACYFCGRIFCGGLILINLIFRLQMGFCLFCHAQMAKYCMFQIQLLLF